MNITQILTRPIPDMTEARSAKEEYRKYPLIIGDHNTEPLVDISEYGIAGQSYYSRDNGATGKPMDDAPSAVLLRQSITERLADINYALQQSNEVAELLGGSVELYVDEGLRSYAVQARLYNEVFPGLIKAQNPSWSKEQVFERRNQLIARPTDDPEQPAPHATGAAFDISFRYTKPNLDFTKGAKVDFGHAPTALDHTANPDYYEHKDRLSKPELIAQQNRRVFFWVMRGALIDDDSDFVVNPTEFWHWSYGDQMWATLRQAPQAFYAIPS